MDVGVAGTKGSIGMSRALGGWLSMLKGAGEMAAEMVVAPSRGEIRPVAQHAANLRFQSEQVREQSERRVTLSLATPQVAGVFAARALCACIGGPWLALLATLLLGVACTPMHTFQTAQPVGKGRWQVGLEAGGGDHRAASHASSLAMWSAIAVRRGVSDRIELGGRLTTGLDIEAHGKFVVAATEALTLAMVPSAGKGIFSSWVAATLLAGIAVNGHEVTLAPRVAYHIQTRGGFMAGSTTDYPQVLVGGTAGVAFELTSGVRLVPEVGVLSALRTHAAYDDTDGPRQAGDAARSLVVSYGLALLLGGQ